MRKIATILLFLHSLYAAAECQKENIPTFNSNSYYANTINETGESLKTALNVIIRGHHRYSYSCVWDILKEADEDPSNASNIIAFYTRRSIPKTRRDQGSGDQDSWNREHIWAKSHGFPQKSQHGYTDAHHLRAADRSVNSDRSDNDFSDGGDADDEGSGCREGSGTWEPPDIVKGDTARMMFYIAVRYEGNDNSATPDLELVDRTTNSGEHFFGKLCTLLQWHLTDPVSDNERQRNDVIYSWQGNRNPFIDHPDLVSNIWGGHCAEGSTVREDLLQRIEKIESELNELRTIIDEAL